MGLTRVQGLPVCGEVVWRRWEGELSTGPGMVIERDPGRRAVGRWRGVPRSWPQEVLEHGAWFWRKVVIGNTRCSLSLEP